MHCAHPMCHEEPLHLIITITQRSKRRARTPLCEFICRLPCTSISTNRNQMYTTAQWPLYVMGTYTHTHTGHTCPNLLVSFFGVHWLCVRIYVRRRLNKWKTYEWYYQLPVTCNVLPSFALACGNCFSTCSTTHRMKQRNQKNRKRPNANKGRAREGRMWHINLLFIISFDRKMKTILLWCPSSSSSSSSSHLICRRSLSGSRATYSTQ